MYMYNGMLIEKVTRKDYCIVGDNGKFVDCSKHLNGRRFPMTLKEAKMCIDMMLA